MNLLSSSIIIIPFFLICSIDYTLQAQSLDRSVEKNIYQFTITDLYGKPFSFASLKGKKILIVNTASECGYTPQYKDLQELYEKYKSQNFIIIGFPANNFCVRN